MERLDIIISKNGVVRSREKAKKMILAGKVSVNGNIINKPSMLFDEDVKIEVNFDMEEYVSRGGLKLEKALKVFNIDVRGLIVMDIGASTGGFTDCMLKNGCRKVYAVDVGVGQLSPELCNDNRVKNLEGINIRYIDNELIDSDIDFFTIDVSFISLNLVLPKIYEIIKNESRGVCLIKPQFEAGRDKVGKRGVVKDSKIHCEVINKVCDFCVKIGFNIIALDYSPIKGPEGNIEYLIYIEKSDVLRINSNINIEKVVRESHKDLNCGER